MQRVGGWRVAAVVIFVGAGVRGVSAWRAPRGSAAGVAPPVPSRGYWMVSSDGGVRAFGSATFLGALNGTRLNRPIVGMAPTPTAKGYWLTATDGGIFAYGDAAFYGSTGSIKLNRP